MKRISFVIVALFVAVLAACQGGTPAGGYHIEGTVEGATGSVILARPAGRSLEGIDTAEVKDGKFEFVGKADKNELVILQFGEGMSAAYSYIFLENADLKVTGSVSEPQKIVAKGGLNNDVWAQFSELYADFQKSSSDLQQKYQSATDSVAQAAIVQEHEASMKTFTSKLSDFVKANNKANASVFVTANMLMAQLEFEELKAVVNNFDASLDTDSMLITLKNDVAVMETIQIGKTAPDFTLNDTAGTPVALSSKYGKGYILLDFWAGWCRPCRAENPNVVEAYKKFSAKGFDVFGVSLDSKAEEWNEAIATDGLTWTQVSDLQFWSSAAAKLYGVKSIPFNLLLDKNGVIVAKNLRGAELHTKLAELLGQ